MIKTVLLELNGKILSEEEIENYVCVSKVVNDTVNTVFERCKKGEA